MYTTSARTGMLSSYVGSFVQTSYSSRMRKPAELMLVPMIDIFTVLVTFLLMTAVFSRITILQLQLPSSNVSGTTAAATFRLEVIVRPLGFELTNGTELIATVPKVGSEYDLKTLSELALALKREHPDANDASVLLERDIQYDYLIQVMDAIRSIDVPAGADASGAGAQENASLAADGKSDDAGTTQATTRVALFSQIAVGEAP
jgi:biopolymer transport protein ExbD